MGFRGAELYILCSLFEESPIELFEEVDSFLASLFTEELEL